MLAVHDTRWNRLLEINGMSRRNAALAYASLGLSVIRVHGSIGAACSCEMGAACKSPGKHPVERDWFNRATADAAQVSEMFPADAPWNVGIVPAASGLALLDLDVKRANTSGVNFFAGTHEQAGGPAATTPSGGAHRLFLRTPDAPATMSKKDLGFDWQTTSGMFVVAPSRTPIGQYRWTAAGAPQPTPRAVLDKLTEAQTLQRDVRYDDAPAVPDFGPADVLRGVELNVGKGDRSEALWGLARTLWQRGCTGAQIMATLLSTQAGAAKAADESGPGWLWRYCVWASAGEIGGYNLATDQLHGSWSGFTPAEAEDAPAPGGVFGYMDAPPARPAVISEIQLGDIETAEIEPPKYVAPMWLPRGLVTSLYGPDGVGKTMWTIQEAMKLAAAGQRVLLVLAEDTSDAIRWRIRAASRHLKLPAAAWAANFVVLDLMDVDVKWGIFDRDGRLTLTPFAESIIERLETEHFDLTALDPISDVYEDDEIRRDRVAPFLRSLNRLAYRRDTAILLLGHPAKAEGSTYSGSGAWSSKVRSRLFMQPETVNGISTVLLTHQKSSYGPKMGDRRYVFTSDGALQELTQDAQAAVTDTRAKAVRTAVLLAVRALAERGEVMSAALNSPNNAARLMARHAMGGEFQPDELRKALGDLLSDGTLADGIELDGKGGRPLVRTTSGRPKSGVWFKPLEF